MDARKVAVKEQVSIYMSTYLVAVHNGINLLLEWTEVGWRETHFNEKQTTPT